MTAVALLLPIRGCMLSRLAGRGSLVQGLRRGSLIQGCNRGTRVRSLKQLAVTMAGRTGPGGNLDPQIEETVERIHSTAFKFVLFVTGGASQVTRLPGGLGCCGGCPALRLPPPGEILTPTLAQGGCCHRPQARRRLRCTPTPCGCLGFTAGSLVASRRARCLQDCVRSASAVCQRQSCRGPWA